MTTNQTERVSDEELDQMIWKLERDGMTPKQLSMMRELREVRREKGEPVAWMYDGEDGREYNGHNEFSGGGKGVPLYAAPSAAVVPTNVADAIERLKQRLADCHRFNYCAEAVREVEDACRAAMLQSSGNSEQLEPVSNRDELMPGIKPAPELDSVAKNAESLPGNSPAIPDGWIPVSERMPDEDGNYWGWWSESKRQGPVWFIKSELQAQFQSSEITHWMPLPAAPKEVG